MKKNKFLLLSLSLGMLPVFPIISASCVDKNKKDDKNNPDPNKPQEDPSKPNKDFSKYSDLSAEFKQIVDKVELGKTFDFKLKDSTLHDKEYKDIYPTQIRNNFDKGIEIIQKENNGELDIQINDVILDEKTANKTGKFQLSLILTDKKTNQIYQKNIEVAGFNTNPYGADENGKIPNDGTETLKPDSNDRISEYIKADQQKRYELDNSKYLAELTRQQRNAPLSEVRPDLNALLDNVKEFNAKAIANNQDTYESAARKGFTLPTYDEHGNFKGLSFYENEMGKGPSWVDALGNRDIYQINGLARTLPNEQYLRTALQTFGITISNHLGENKFQTISGTMWIMDYQKRADGKYPTKWYFATNLHVADALRNNSVNFSLLKLMKTAKTKTTFRLTNLDDNFNRFSFNSKDNQFIVNNGLKTIYSARNFLNTKPSDYLTENQKNKYNNVEEFSDFSVFEIDFEKLNLDGVSGNMLNQNLSDLTSKYSGLDVHNLAKLITNDYANEANKNDWIKFKSKSYLKDYSKIEYPLVAPKNNPEWFKNYDELFAVGYPNSTGDYFLRQYSDDDQIKYRTQFNFSLWTNSDYRFYDNLGKDASMDERAKRGNYLSYTLGYRSFTNKPGILDSFISAPHTGDKLYTSNDDNQYSAMGLEYLIRHYAPVGGASGSSVRNQNNEIVGIYHISNISAHTGLAAAFRSEGHNYNGLYGTYNLPQYDLIYGGGQNQISSYRQALIKEYEGQVIKTNLFSNGLNDIPDEYKF